MTRSTVERQHRTSPRPAHPARLDRTLRVVMWLDAFLSLAMVAVCLLAGAVAAPLATVGVPRALATALVVTAIVSAALLAAFGAVTAVALMIRMSGGQFGLPPGLRLPLPRVMRPDLR